MDPDARVGLNMAKSLHHEISHRVGLSMANKRQKDCLWKQRTHYRLENGSLDFIATLHKQ